MKIVDVDPNSPLFGYVRPGYTLLSINGEKVLDNIDFTFKVTDEQVNICFADPGGREVAFEFDEVTVADLGLTLDDHKIRRCSNDCLFCFVDQQPQGMRKPLYIKDEDYRLSFTHGNFITLSNTSEADLKRIVTQRLSPLYISVHATDDDLRRRLMRNEKLAPIIPRLKFLCEYGLTLHTQVVLCPNVNDGPHLERTIDELAALYPGVRTLAVVPVGLTKYRQHLPQLRTYTPSEACGIIDYVESGQLKFTESLGSRFVWPADEFYVCAGRDFPGLSAYEEMSQSENGVGMTRHFIATFNRRRPGLNGLRSNKRVLFLTGTSAFPIFSRDIMPYLRDEIGLDIHLEAVPNRFWGEMVTVSGLLTGQDLLDHARKMADRFDTVVLPPNCLNADNLFLDDLSLDQFRRELPVEVAVGQYNLAQTVKELFT
jgi:putative radical SAM enzyme (TIGR03279 family)